MNLFKIIVFSFYLIFSINCKTFEVKTDKEFLKALQEVGAGDTIELHNGKYHNKFIAERSGTSSAPITLTGSKSAVISGYNYGFWLKANHWVLKGFTVTDSNKGIVLDEANHNILEDLDVHNIKQEGIHFRLNSADNVLRKSRIYKTGTGSPGFGEGVYIGSAVSHWESHKPDKSDRNQIVDNQFGPNVAAECIDVKEGTCCGLIKGNNFDGTGMSGENFADSWVDLKGENYTIEDNVGNHSLLDGIQIHYVKASNMGGCDNKIKNNKCSGLPSAGVCVSDHSNNVCSSNRKNVISN